MPLKQYKPTTPTRRFTVLNKRTDLSKKRPEKSLTEPKPKSAGRNCHGRITSRRRGGGHKRLYRIVDFRRQRYDEPAEVMALEYDPNRSASLALLQYADGQKTYILAPRGLAVGDKVVSATKVAEFRPGNAMPLAVIPPATFVHNVEMVPGRGGRIARSAGNHVILVNVDGERAQVKMPSGEIRILPSACRATIGEVGNNEHFNQSLGKAGRNRWKGRRPRVRGVAMNPVDHPMGGGAGKTSGGGHPVSPWGQLAKGFPTRQRSKPSNSAIITRRNGRKLKVR